MYTEYTILQRMHSYVDESILLDTFKYNHFRCAWYSFLQLLDIDYSANYCCKLCGDRPDTLIMDATAVSSEKLWIPGIPLLVFFHHHVRI